MTSQIAIFLKRAILKNWPNLFHNSMYILGCCEEPFYGDHAHAGRTKYDFPLQIWVKMLKNRRKCEKPPNSTKIPRARLWKRFHRTASTRKPHARKKNFEVISHRKKVRWTTYELWPPSWIFEIVRTFKDFPSLGPRLTFFSIQFPTTMPSFMLSSGFEGL